jgi:hypothetical protein
LNSSFSSTLTLAQHETLVHNREAGINLRGIDGAGPVLDGTTDQAAIEALLAGIRR